MYFVNNFKHFLLLLYGDIEVNPGPKRSSNIKFCLCMESSPPSGRWGGGQFYWALEDLKFSPAPGWLTQMGNLKSLTLQSSGFNNWRTLHTYVCLLLLTYTWFWACVRWCVRSFFLNKNFDKNLSLPQSTCQFRMSVIK